MGDILLKHATPSSSSDEVVIRLVSDKKKEEKKDLYIVFEKICLTENMSPALKMDAVGGTIIDCGKRKNSFEAEVSPVTQQSKKIKLGTNGDMTLSSCTEFLKESCINHSVKDSVVRVSDTNSFFNLFCKHFIPNHSSDTSLETKKETVPLTNGNSHSLSEDKKEVPLNSINCNKPKFSLNNSHNQEEYVKFCKDNKFSHTQNGSVIRVHNPSTFLTVLTDSIVPNKLSSVQSPFWTGLRQVQSDNSFVTDNIQRLGSDLNKCQDFIVNGRSKWTLDASLLPKNISIPHTNGSSALSKSLLQSAFAQEKQEIEGIQYVTEQTCNRTAKLPPEGPLEKKPLTVNSKVYVMKGNLLQAWVKGVIIKDEVHNGEQKFKVRLDRNNRTRWCTKKMVAYEQTPDVRLTFCRRVIAIFTPEDKSIRPAMYAGVVGEIPKVINQFRYLIFFDDGIAQYVYPENVRVIYDESKNVWEDVAEENKSFVKQIIDDYPEKIMLRVKKGQLIKSEYNGKWVYAKVMTVDGSMVKLLFEGERRYEWLYRGSTRLEALYKELENAKQNQLTGRVRRHFHPGKNRENQPYVEYTQNQDVDEIVIDSDSDSETKADAEDATDNEPVKRNVARKSTTQIKKIVGPKKTSLPISTFKEGRIETIIEDHPALTYKKHNYGICTKLCLRENDRMQYKYENPLCLPMRFGFERRNGPFRRRGNAPRNNIYYRAPCGRMLRNLDEILRYLTITNCELTIDMFSLDPDVIPNRYFRITKDETLWLCEDITEGVEKLPIPCVNCLTNESPPYVKYANEPFPGRGVKFTTDENFLCGCNCTDNCEDSSKCQCQQLTASMAAKPGEKPTQTGYKYRRLHETVLTAVYECNSQCACKKTCVNRVVQHGIQCRLQMFKTEKKGWGVRCLDDLDAGTFLTIYAGQVQTDAAADEDGIRLGDEYLADLDHIEVAETHKFGYEAEAIMDEEDEVDESKSTKEESEDEAEDSDNKSSSSDSPPEMFHDSDSDYEDFAAESILNDNFTTRSTRSKKKISSDKDSESKESSDIQQTTSRLGSSLIISDVESNTENQSPNFIKHTGGAKKSSGIQRPGMPPFSETKEKVSKLGAFKIRSYFKEKDPYIMDAKIKGNIGRYLNHSCCPNSFVQNVFFETHDLRFPTVAFFTGQQITAGTELTWDYSYEIGSVQGKKLVCHCGTASCRGRLL